MSSMFAQTQFFESSSQEKGENHDGQPDTAISAAQQIQNADSLINNQADAQANINAKKFVMIDQQQLLELMQAKQILDAQRQLNIAETHYPVQAPASGLNSAVNQNIGMNQVNNVYRTPQKNEIHESSTDVNKNLISSQSDKMAKTTPGDGQTTVSSQKVLESGNEGNQEQSLFKAPFMFTLDDDFPAEENEAQSNNIKNSLLNMMDEEPSDHVDRQMSNLVDAIQSVDLNKLANLQGDHLDQKQINHDFNHLNSSIFRGSSASTFNPSNEASGCYTDNSIFSANTPDSYYRGPAMPATVNNITINNFNAPVPQMQHYYEPQQQQQMHDGQQQAFFPPLKSVVRQGPTMQQAAELAQVTQMAGGVKPLHHNPNSVKTSSAGQYQATFACAQAEPIPDDSESDDDDESKLDQAEEVGKRRKKNKKFDFPEGGWECKKCQNYNFKGRKECFRCKKGKDDCDYDGKPKHMFLPAEQKAFLKAAKTRKNQRQKLNKQIRKQAELNGEQAPEQELTNLNQINSFATTNPFGAPVQNQCQKPQPRPFQAQKGLAQKQGSTGERVGDWTCQRCFNHNYSFREVCNMCYLSHIESNKMLYNQQQNRLDTIQGGGAQQPQYYQNPQYQQQEYEYQGQPMYNEYSPQQNQEYNMMYQPEQQQMENFQTPAFAPLSQSAKPFIPTFLKQNSEQPVITE